MKYANTEINFTPERLVEIAQLAIDGLRCDDEDSAMEYFADTMELTKEEAEFFGIGYKEMKTYSRYYEESEEDDDKGVWDELEREIFEGNHPYLEPWDI